jgi:hypothetical protein
MTYRFDDGQIGYPPIESVVAVPVSPAVVPSWSPGFIAVAEDPVWGPGEFVFARASAGIRAYGLCTFLPVWDATNKIYTMNMVEAPATTLIGRGLYVCQAAGGLTTGQYGWFMTTGLTPVNSNASIAADTTAGHVATGQAGANAVGIQIVNARVVTPATQTVASPGSGRAGDTVIRLANTQGFFPGAYLSGTGVGTNAIVTSVGNGFVTASVVNSAAISGNVTATYNNATIFYNVLEMNRAFGQGAIT